MELAGKNVLIGASGSVSASCSIPLACDLKKLGSNVKIVLTDNAARFFFFECNVCETLTDANYNETITTDLYD